MLSAGTEKYASLIQRPISLFERKKKELLNKPFGFPLESGKTSEIDILRQGGEKTVAEMRVAEIDWEGEPAYLASLRDITERKRMEEALRQSEEKFSKAFRSSPDVIAITTLEDGRFIEVNDNFTRVAGYTREELINHRTNELGIWVKADDRARMVKMLKEQGTVGNKEFDIRIKSGEVRTWLFSAEPINIGSEPCLISVATDVTERKRAGEALRFSAAAFRSIHESVVATDTKYTITHWNEISERIYGLKASEAIGQKAPGCGQHRRDPSRRKCRASQ